MDYLDWIIRIGGAVTAIGVILGLLFKVWNFFKKINKNITEFKDTLSDLEEHSNENYMGILRLTIMSSEMPIGERIVAGHKYLENNGNGDVKKFLNDEFNITDTVDEATHYKK